jgi:alpha-1,2-mannosyltransferase
MNSRYSEWVRIFVFGLIIFFFFSLNFIYLSQNWFPAISGKSPLVDVNGDPVGGDFIVFYAASSLALSGQFAGIYESSVLQDRINKIVGKKINYYWWYPPTFLLMVYPLAKAPYFSSLLIWLFSTLALYIIVIFIIAPLPATVPLAFCFPGTFINLSCGQNGFLSATLLGGGLILLDKFPRLGGVFLGLLTYKPHLAVLIPVALIAGKRWQTLATFFLVASFLALSSLLIFGPEIWQAFFHTLFHPAQKLQGGAWDWAKMPTVFAAVFLMGGKLTTAYSIQAVAMLGVAVGVVTLWLKNFPVPERNAGLVLGILLFTPYAFHYDLPLLALPIAWMGWRGYTIGSPSGQKAILVFAWLSPFITYCLKNFLFLNLPITVSTVLLLFMFTFKKYNMVDSNTQ